MSATNNPELFSQAQHLWKFLDSLAESDPEAYKEFINKQVKERKDLKLKQKTSSEEENSPFFIPSPLFVLQCFNTANNNSSSPQSLIINICISSQVEPILTQQRQPASNDEIRAMHGLLIPLSISTQKKLFHAQIERKTENSAENLKDFNSDILNVLQSLPQCQPKFPSLTLHNNNDSKKEFSLGFDVVFNPSTMIQASQSLSLLLTVLNVAFEHIVKDNPNIRLHEQFRIINGIIYIGERTKQKSRTEEKTSSSTSANKSSTTESNTSSSPINKIILPTSSLINKEEEAKHEIPILKTSVEPNKRPLIEEIDSSPSLITTTPEYFIDNNVNNDKLIIRVLLPDIDSIDSLDVELTDNLLNISGDGILLNLSLPCLVDGDNSQAKWIKKKHELKITATKQ